MVKINIVRKKPDPIAIATRGERTSQIETQVSDDRLEIISTLTEG